MHKSPLPTGMPLQASKLTIQIWWPYHMTQNMTELWTTSCKMELRQQRQITTSQAQHPLDKLRSMATCWSLLHTHLHAKMHCKQERKYKSVLCKQGPTNVLIKAELKIVLEISQPAVQYLWLVAAQHHKPCYLSLVFLTSTACAPQRVWHILNASHKQPEKWGHH